MAEQSFQERTERATPRKRREAREKGNVPKSIEVNSVVVLLMGMLALRFFGKTIFSRIEEAMRWIFSRLHVLEINVNNVPAFLWSGVTFMGALLAPVVLIILVAGILANIVQSGFVFAGDPVKPKLSKVSPAKGFKRIFSMRSLVELIKSVLKLCIVGVIGYFTLKAELNVYPYLFDKDVAQVVGFIGGMSYKLAIRTCLVLIVLAVLDYAYQRFEYEKQLRMTKQEVKEEFKQSEGDPLIKSRIRSIQMKQARQRMLADVPEADVVVTNPIHLAVALKYESAKMAAPTVVAKGARLVAEKIKEIASEHGVPIVENKPVARMLFKTTEIGQAIPFGQHHSLDHGKTLGGAVLQIGVRLLAVEAVKELPGRVAQVKEWPPVLVNQVTAVLADA